jgi:predicted alpha/beta hydrolase family esterase
MWNRRMKMNALTLPGLGNSGAGHWQSRWEQAWPGIVRVQQRDWSQPVCHEWTETLESAVARAGSDVVLVAHSLGCLLVASWSVRTRLAIRGALLVAPPDPDGPNFPAAPRGFSSPPRTPLSFSSIVVASTNDPYGSLAFARSCAENWGSEFADIGAAGHINAASGLGDWPEGFTQFRRLLP